MNVGQGRTHPHDRGPRFAPIRLIWLSSCKVAKLAQWNFQVMAPVLVADHVEFVHDDYSCGPEALNSELQVRMNART
eukprot:scaffold2534_cov364-Prasinococcus_capsulatus_cf.AAC.3